LALSGVVGTVGTLVTFGLGGSAPGAAGATGPSTVPAYWLVASDGGIFAFGGAPFDGSMGGQHLNRPVVGMAASATGGYWEVASDGGIFAFGAPFEGSMGGRPLNRPVVGMAQDSATGGYWEVASDGGIFAFGAPFEGSMGGRPLNQPIVGMAATPDGGGYWLVASDGGIFAFGDAQYEGSMGGRPLNQPIVGMAPSADGQGYWEVARDGGIFAFGDAPYKGSLGGVPQSRPVVAIAGVPAATAAAGGYWFSNSNGAVSAFGSATYWGSAPQVLNQPVVAMAEGAGSGSFTGGPFASGSFGYDISNFQCAGQPPAPHTVGVVEVEGASFGSTNPCLATEANWAGAGLNLYLYLTYGTTPPSPPSVTDPACAGAETPAACSFGFADALDAFAKAQRAGVDTAVAWWLDVESDPSWSPDPAANASLVQGALDGLHYEGLNNVGIYASPGSWNGIVGTYQPAVPYWVASWGVAPTTTCAQVRTLFPRAQLPSGPVQMVQYSSPSAPIAEGGMSTSFDDDYAC
jgi:hypothetical protein